MCIIMSCSEKHPTRDMLMLAESVNPHGAGMSWIKNGMVYWRKGINAKQIYKMIKSENIKLPYTVHFRIASIGAITKQLTHPFPIEQTASTKLHGKADSVLFHNGTWTDWKKEVKNVIKKKHLRKLPKGEMSDSRAMAFLTSINGTKYFDKMVWNKVLIQDVKESHEYGTWQTVDNIKCSNNFGLVENQFQFYDMYDKYDSYDNNYQDRYSLSKTSSSTFDNKMLEYNTYIYSDNWNYVEQADYQDLKKLLYSHKQGYCECYQCEHILESLTAIQKELKGKWKNTRRLAISENIKSMDERINDSRQIGNPMNDYEFNYNEIQNENMINAKQYMKNKRRGD